MWRLLGFLMVAQVPGHGANGVMEVGIAGGASVLDDADLCWGDSDDMCCQWDTATTPDALMCVGAGPVCWGPTGECDPADFTYAMSISSAGNTGYTDTSSNIGIVGEGYATNKAGVGVVGAAKTYNTNNSYGVRGVGKVAASADASSAYGGEFISTDTHAGGVNGAIHLNAANGATNYALVTSAGDFYTVEMDWDVVDNTASALSIDAAGKAGILVIVSTNSSEGVSMSGTLGVTGNTTLSGQANHATNTVTCATDTDDFDIDWDNGNIAFLDMEGCDQDANDVNAPTNPVEGSSYSIVIEQGAAGTEDLTWNAAFLFPGGTDPVLTQSANARDVVSCMYVDSIYHCSFAQDYQ